MNEIKACIVEQIGKEKYPDMRKQILDQNINNPKEQYVKYVKDIFLGEHTTNLPLSTEAWYTTYFTASVISESARNFRTFPLILMALDMVESSDNNIQSKGLKFLFEEHSMASGGSWIDTNRRGFSGSAKTQGRSMTKLETIIRKEFELYQSWNQMHGNVDNVQSIMNMLEKYKLIENDLGRQSTINEYRTFKESSKTSTSGILGGYSNGHTTSQDLKSATELENSFKLESYFSRVRALSAEQIHSHIKAKYGENLEGLHFQEGSARMENGQFIFNVVSEGTDIEPVEFRVALSPESQHYNEKMLKGIDT
ncbi:uncharacterized protein LOC118326085, partial [Morone saxatilis]|uniref:uncharacterized protein LOC118326085 n=1 Tax=Morone saxatilis TaxID=34816 RepID=UPI0015E22511